MVRSVQLQSMKGILLSLIFLAATVRLSETTRTCYSCTSVRNVTSCNSTVTCGQDERCFMAVSFNSQIGVKEFSLGCRTEQVCNGVSGSVGLIGKKRTSAAGHDDCNECCSTDGCNNFLCSNTSTATVDGGWSTWTHWSECNGTCGGLGTQERHRLCNNPPPQNGRICHGDVVDRNTCYTVACTVDGGWSTWLSWEPCSTTCGTGMKRRHRTCTSPAPDYHGNYCPGDAHDYGLCTVSNCSQNGDWSSWLSWEPCSTTCGTGMRRRNRTCTSPVPSNHGNNCRGDSHDFELCTMSNCSRNGGWSDWSSWGSCKGPCVNGLKTRTRSCTSPTPKGHGLACAGDTHDYSICTKDCIVRKSNLRLVNGNGAAAGRVEVFYNSVWGTVCDDGWNNTDATVVCKQLGFSTGTAYQGSQHHFGKGVGQIWLDGVQCTGSETFIGYCHHNNWGTNDCTHTEDAGVQCA